MIFKIPENKRYYNQLKKIIQKLANELNIKIILDPNLPLFFGETNTIGFEIKNIRIGTKNYLYQKDIKNTYVFSLITLFHELRHFEQIQSIKDGKAVKELLYNLLAIKKNQDFYNSNYLQDFSELEANYYGIFRAYEYIKQNHLEIDILSNIKNYMHESELFRDYYVIIDESKSMEELDQFVFEPMFDRLPSIPKTIDRCSSEKSKSHTPDEFLLSFQEYCNDRDIYYPDLLIRAKCNTSENINFLSDKIIGTVMISLHPEYEELLKKNNLKEQSLDEVMQELMDLAYEPPGKP